MIQEAVMATQKARILSMLGGALTVLGLASLSGALNHAACLLSAFFGFPVKTLLEVLPSVILAAWHVLEPCLFAHIRLLDGLLQVSLSCGQLLLAFAGVA